MSSKLIEPSRLPLILMVLTSFQDRLTLMVFRLRRLRLGYFFLLIVSSSYFTLVSWLNGMRFEAL
jgi:hypothetical protein